MRPKIVFSMVSKKYDLYKKQSDKLIDIIFNRRATKDGFFALKNVSFEIYEGEVVGVIGLNGSGKSTLSNLLAQVIPPTCGSIEINGETSLIAISAGLNNQLSGLENIELKCLMHGLKNDEIQRLKDKIIDFADIGNFINQPVKNYSSGMKSRLGFAISIHTNPDILIVDEALSVGDPTFYQKCLNKMNEFKSQGKTIIFISHSISQIKEFCDRVMWIHFGRINKFDEADIVVGEYKEFIKWFNSLNDEEKKVYKAKMFQSQYKEDSISEFTPFGRQRHRNKRRSSIKRKDNNFFALQFITIFLAVLFCASLMFGVNPVKDIEKYINIIFTKEQIPTEPSTNGVSLNEKNQKNRMVAVNKTGIAILGQSDIYSDYEMNTPNGKIAFSEEIFVLEKKGNIYKIRTNNKIIGYTNIENIKVLEEELPIAKEEISNFTSLFPQRFSSAHEYFLNFLNTQSEEVKSKLRGLTNEGVVESGKKTLNYSIYDAEYTVNSENITESITISNIKTDIREWNQLKENASLISNDSQYYYFNLEKYKVVIDIINKKAIVSFKE